MSPATRETSCTAAVRDLLLSGSRGKEFGQGVDHERETGLQRRRQRVAHIKRGDTDADEVDLRGVAVHLVGQGEKGGCFNRWLRAARRGHLMGSDESGCW
ncbi:MAG: hypothetical protein LH650_05345 [Chloroflexi bacterium]|nr:hypothetical protein [Chloroflexota bacterium]